MLVSLAHASERGVPCPLLWPSPARNTRPAILSWDHPVGRECTRERCPPAGRPTCLGLVPSSQTMGGRHREQVILVRIHMSNLDGIKSVSETILDGDLEESGLRGGYSV